MTAYVFASANAAGTPGNRIGGLALISVMQLSGLARSEVIRAFETRKLNLVMHLLQ